MKIIEPYYEIISHIDKTEAFRIIELAGRTCYKSDDKITENSAENFVKKIVELGHESVLEHYNITIKFVCNRGFSHELVRHRLASYSQESTRYCNYSKDKFSNEITVIKPYYFDTWTKKAQFLWKSLIKLSEITYITLLKCKLKPEITRGVLPLDLKTEIVITTNIREWRHILKLRTSHKVHPDMLRLMRPLEIELKKIFGDFLF